MKIRVSHCVGSEVEFVRSILRPVNTALFLAHNYNVDLPNGTRLDDEPSETLAATIRHEYKSHITVYEECATKLSNVWGEKRKSISAFFDTFPYKAPEEIYITITRYGPGGSYTLPNKILVKASQIKARSIATILHEIIHLAIEEPLVRGYDLTHTEKEAVVDYFCKKLVTDKVLDEYSPQNFGLTNSETNEILRRVGVLK